MHFDSNTKASRRLLTSLLKNRGMTSKDNWRQITLLWSDKASGHGVRASIGQMGLNDVLWQENTHRVNLIFSLIGKQHKLVAAIFGVALTCDHDQVHGREEESMRIKRRTFLQGIVGRPEQLFSAENVWSSSGTGGPERIEQSRQLWGVPWFDLVQIHNLITRGSVHL